MGDGRVDERVVVGVDEDATCAIDGGETRRVGMPRDGGGGAVGGRGRGGKRAAERQRQRPPAELGGNVRGDGDGVAVRRGRGGERAGRVGELDRGGRLESERGRVRRVAQAKRAARLPQRRHLACERGGPTRISGSPWTDEPRWGDERRERARGELGDRVVDACGRANPAARARVTRRARCPSDPAERASTFVRSPLARAAPKRSMSISNFYWYTHLSPIRGLFSRVLVRVRFGRSYSQNERAPIFLRPHRRHRRRRRRRL